MKLGYMILYVENVLETVDFYEHALGLKRLFVHESNGYAEMDTGSTKLAFTSLELAKESGLDFGQLKRLSSPGPFEIALVTENVENAFAKAVKNGAQELKKPMEKPWGQIVGYVKDPNGNLIEICSPMHD
jgi:predicted enzyme related to lactoylglutathione lyase